jgi:hypothetical protein
MLAPGAMNGFGDFRGTRALHARRGSFKSPYSPEQGVHQRALLRPMEPAEFKPSAIFGEAEASMKSIGVPAPKHRNFIGGLQLRQVSAFQLKE